MSYVKKRPDISLEEFLKEAKKVKAFKSKTGKSYEVVTVEGSMMHIIREHTGKPSPMNLEGVWNAYRKLDNFTTKNFAPYVVSRTHSPSLGLLIHLGLLERN
ncbi:hypothetical protein M8998_07195 [Sphingobacterium sp. lm-10]|uniref:hypothetical protein n=1 Tax=Sphingobacterium sp. lm-10 TaxID=2944904 RepID=UPI002021D1D7|nr:hypothetical protein [Sphingobacterium sp. lm-10]MCL7987719.1 hypothetical protein [Sphingobacterium sp. lm-10]